MAHINKKQAFYSSVKAQANGCVMIKRNESDVGDVVFDILAKTVFKFLFHIVFTIANSFLTL